MEWAAGRRWVELTGLMGRGEEGDGMCSAMCSAMWSAIYGTMYIAKYSTKYSTILVKIYSNSTE